MSTRERASNQKSRGPEAGRGSNDLAMEMAEHLPTVVMAMIAAVVFNTFEGMFYDGWTLETAIGLTQIQLLGQDGSIPNMIMTYPETAGYWALRGAGVASIGVGAFALLKMISAIFSEVREIARDINTSSSPKKVAYGN